MSHFTELKTQIKDIDTLKSTLQSLELEFEYEPEGCEVRGFYGDTIKAILKIHTGTEYDVGMRANQDGSYDFIADWEMLKNKGFDSEAFTGRILQRYSYSSIRKTLEHQGYEFEEESVDEHGNIQLVVSQW